ncbi:methyltransferase domain-containing protein [uncultured Roseibium sp.]|uniref:class I SAM-dependent methyltransferase n=1 Tax=uncultured Roseibium sp. TaxID=1936171 RepID=UPI0026394095|nr:methyltransferase domain-containing protein [uncultured Roseibium sp.]
MSHDTKVGSWSFEKTSIAEEFDAHVRKHLPWYDLLSDKVADIAAGYLQESGMLLDCGCSTADLAIRMESVLKSRDACYIGVDISDEMIEIANERISAEVYSMNFDISVANAFDELRNKADWYNVVVANLFVMFLPAEDRKHFLEKAINSLTPGGVLIVVDRIVNEGGYLSNVLNRSTMADKLRAGVSTEEIGSKEISLIGVQRPTDPALYDTAREFFRFGDFVGYVFEKPY